MNLPLANSRARVVLLVCCGALALPLGFFAVRNAIAERALTPAAIDTDFRVVPAEDQPRLRGAAALVSAPAYAAPAVA